MTEVTTSVYQGFLMTMLSAHYNNYVHLSSYEYAATWPLLFQNHKITTYGSIQTIDHGMDEKLTTGLLNTPVLPFHAFFIASGKEVPFPYHQEGSNQMLDTASYIVN